MISRSSADPMGSAGANAHSLGARYVEFHVDSFQGPRLDVVSIEWPGRSDLMPTRCVWVERRWRMKMRAIVAI